MSAVAQKLAARVASANSLLCVGLDPSAEVLPPALAAEDYPLAAFCVWMVQQTYRHVCAYKFNLAFFEARGAAGLEELQGTLDWLRATLPDIVLIGDAKRADIGHSSTAYAEALFDRLGFDAVTLNPYLGADALAPFLERDDKASIIVCRTTNPGAGEFQDLLVDGTPLWAHILGRARDQWNARGNVWAVIGATTPADLLHARELAPAMPFLVPGVGAQGGDATETVRAGRTADGTGLVVNVGRAILLAEQPGATAQAYRDALNAGRA